MAVVVGGVADGVVGYSFEHEAVEEFKFHLIRLVRFVQLRETGSPRDRNGWGCCHSSDSVVTAAGVLVII